MATIPANRPLVVIAFPPMARPRWVENFGEAFPEVEIIAVSYDEPMEMRLARGRGDTIALAERPPLSAEQADAFARAEVILAFDVPTDMGSLAPNLRWVQQIGAGVDHLNGAALGPDVAVTSATGISAVPIAEFVMGRLLAVWKQFGELDAAQREHRWVQLYGRRFAGSTVAIIGLGAIGTEVAIRAQSFGARVLGVRRRADLAPPPGVAEVYPPSALHDVLAQADAVVVAAPAGDETRNLFDEASFAAMKPGAVFCNVARGSLVDEAALISALESGQVGAAILDVTVLEPLPEEDPLWSAPNIHLSAHCSTVVSDYLDQLAELFSDNLRRYLRQEPMRNLV